jgi:hypothetical protein
VVIVEQGKSWVNQTLGLYPATKYSPESQKTAILEAEFLACCSPLGNQNFPRHFLSRAGILLKVPIEVAL